MGATASMPMLRERDNPHQGRLRAVHAGWVKKDVTASKSMLRRCDTERDSGARHMPGR
jgi:hypothetical protein